MGKFQSHFLKNNTIPLGFPSWNRERVVELQGRETTDTWKKWNRWNCSFFIITPLYNKILVIHIILLWSMLYQFYINAIHGCKVRSLLHSSKFIKSISVRFFANHESKLLSQCFGAALGMFCASPFCSETDGSYKFGNFACESRSSIRFELSACKGRTVQ